MLLKIKSDISFKFGKIKSAVNSFLDDERGADMPVVAILAAVFGTCALGAAVYIMTQVKDTTDGTGQTIRDAGSETYS